MFLRECSTGDIMSKKDQESAQMKTEAQLNTEQLFGGPQKISDAEVKDQEEVDDQEEEGEEELDEDGDAGESGSDKDLDPGTDLEERVYRSIQSSNDKVTNQIDKLAGIVENLTEKINNIQSKNTFDIDSIKPDEVITGEQLINFKNSLENKSPPPKKEAPIWKDPTLDAINKLPDVDAVVAFAEKNNIKIPEYLANGDAASKYWFIKSKMVKPKKKKGGLPDISGSTKPGGNKPKKKMNRTERFFAS